MNEFFTLSASLSPHAKWVLIHLIKRKVIGDEISKNDLKDLGCPFNKFIEVITELQKFNAISKLEVESFKRGRPALSYSFIYKCPNKIDKLIPSEMLTKLEGLKLRVPIKLVWSFFALNQDEHGYIEGFTMGNIAKACGLKIVVVKTAIKQLDNANLLSQPVKGCTIKKYNSEIPKAIKDSIGSEANNLKRYSTFKINNDKETHAIYLITLPPITNRKLNSYTTIFLSLLQDKPLKSDSIFKELLHFENKGLDSCPKQYDEIGFLIQQPPQVFDHFDDVIFKLASYGLLCLLNKTVHVIKPISEEDAFNQILSPAKNFESMAAIHGRLTSELIGHFANILAHYILYTFYQNRCDMDLPDTPDKRQYLSWITSLNLINKSIDIELIRTPTKVEISDIKPIENLVISSTIDFSDKVNITNMNVDFRDPKSNLESGQYPVFQCVPDSFAHFYKTVITSEQ